MLRMPEKRFCRSGVWVPLILLWTLAFPSLAADGPTWHGNYDAALAVGMSDHRPVLVLFDAPATSVRRKNILPDLDHAPAFVEFASRQLVLAVVPPPNSSRDAAVERQARQLRANHGVGSLPALVLLDPDGRSLGSPSLRPNQSAQELVRSIERLIPRSLLIPATNSPPKTSGPLSVDLSSPTGMPATVAATLDLEKMRREGTRGSYPSLIIVSPDTVAGTNILNRRMPP